MYRHPHFVEDRPEVQHALIRAHPFGLLITGGRHGLDSNPLPMLLHIDADGQTMLHGHLSKANTQLQALAEADDTLVIFQGPHSYITPNWYPTKHETGKAVPTWNYAIVEVRGTPRLMTDRDWLLAHVTELSATHEQSQPVPWAVDDAPERFVSGLLKGITGIEISVSHIEAKWKVSQNRPAADRQGVADGIAETDPEMETLIRQHLPDA